MYEQFTTYEQGIIDRGGWNADCAFCREAGRPGGFFPAHTASVTCQSGKRNHCTCDACF